ncbi:hypothetical protein C8Q77DRAFT_1125096 [Trametes polyzona]|nr:hypothetical protein C8Q77DRAFT_1125096 [Trametes polyzona]
MQERPRQIPLLDLDTFRLILHYVSGTELLTFTLVSRVIRAEATMELLRRPVHILRNQRLRFFCRYLLSGDIRKPSYLRKLIINHIEKPLGPEDNDMFIQVLNRCTNLEALDLRWCDVLLEEDTRIPAAIASLPSLSRFSAYLYRDRQELQTILFSIVRSLKTSLRTLRLPQISDEIASADVLNEIARTHHQLEELTFHIVGFTPLTHAFASVRKLHLICEEWLPKLSDVCSTFPNAREVTFDNYMFLDEAPQFVHENAVWPSLDFLRATTGLIHTLGITFPVRHWDAAFYDHAAHDQMTEVISRFRPRKLTICVHCASNWDIPRAHPNLVVYDSGKSGVKHLFVKATVSQPRMAATADFVATLRPLLQDSHVELLHLAVSPFFTSDDPDEIIKPPMKYSGLPEAEAPPDVDVGVLAADIAQLSPSIRTIAVTVASLGHFVWTVARTEYGDAVVVKHEPYEARRTFDAEAERCLRE